MTMDAQLKSQIRRTRKARRFMLNTCPASRHVHLIAESLARGDKYHMIDEDPQHVAISLLSVLESLWNTRTETEWPSDKDRRRWKRGTKDILAFKGGKPSSVSRPQLGGEA